MEILKPNTNHSFAEMQCLDLFSSTLHFNDLQVVQKRTKPTHRLIHPLMSAQQACWHTAEYSFLRELDDREVLTHLHKLYRWNISIDTLLVQPFDAVVITNARKKIQWVSKGHHALTGYPTQEVLGKKPNLFQGPDTKSEDIINLRNGLNSGNHFQSSILNYRKDGSAYMCHISIFPLCNSNQQMEHFVAFERFSDQ
jgi:PAS domain S-box-containing protein